MGDSYFDCMAGVQLLSKSRWNNAMHRCWQLVEAIDFSQMLVFNLDAFLGCRSWILWMGFMKFGVEEVIQSTMLALDALKVEIQKL